MELCVNIYPKVIGGLNFIGNIPGIFLKKPGKIMEISWNFVSPKLWEPCIWGADDQTTSLDLPQIQNLGF